MHKNWELPRLPKTWKKHSKRCKHVCLNVFTSQESISIMRRKYVINDTVFENFSPKLHLNQRYRVCLPFLVLTTPPKNLRV